MSLQWCGASPRDRSRRRAAYRPVSPDVNRTLGLGGEGALCVKRIVGLAWHSPEHSQMGHVSREHVLT
jgi:hypothetical protein